MTILNENIDLDRRKIFADFLSRIALGEAKSEEWQNLSIAHYRDDRLEEIRCQVVRLSIESLDILHTCSEQEKSQLLTWRNEILR